MVPDVQATRFANSLRNSHIMDKDTPWSWEFLPEVCNLRRNERLVAQCAMFKIDCPTTHLVWLHVQLVSSPLLYRPTSSPSASKNAPASDALQHGKAVDRLLTYFGQPEYIKRTCLGPGCLTSCRSLWRAQRTF